MNSYITRLIEITKNQSQKYARPLGMLLAEMARRFSITYLNIQGKLTVKCLICMTFFTKSHAKI